MRRGKTMDLKTLQDTPPWDWPEDTGRMLLGVLKDAKAPEEDRLIAVDLAGDTTVVDDRMAEALLAIAGDDQCSEEMRWRAAISLGPALEHSDLMGFEDPEDITLTEEMFEKVQAGLRRLYSDARVPAEVRRRILEASVRAPQDWHAEAIRAMFPVREGGKRLTAVFCMRYVRGFDAEILEALDDEEPAIRCEAILAAGVWEIDAAWPKVKPLLVRGRGTDKPLLLAAIEASATLEPDEARELLEPLADSDDEDINDAVSEALETAEVARLHKAGWPGDDEDDEDDDEDGDFDGEDEDSDGEDEDDEDDEDEDEDGDDEDGGKVLN